MSKLTNQARIVGLETFTRARKESNLKRLREAADKVFGEKGYFAPTIEDIAQAAGVSRQTFYRHFETKYAIALDMFERESAAVDPLWRVIGERNFRKREVIVAWMEKLFEVYNSRRRIMRTIIEMGVVERSFMARIERIVPDVIRDLGESIPAFAATRGSGKAAKRRWAEAWLLLYQVLDQCTITSMGFLQMPRELLVELLAERLYQFMNPKS
jgi:AcrR family transcriptional regulator